MAVAAALALGDVSAEVLAATGVDVVLRVGLSAGDVVAAGDDWYGTPVVEAARLCAAAADTQVLAADLVRRLAGSRTAAEFTPIGPLSLKGLPEPIEAFAVTATAATQGAAPGAGWGVGRPRSAGGTVRGRARRVARRPSCPRQP